VGSSTNLHLLWNLGDLNGLFWKMFPAFSTAKTGRISDTSLNGWMNSGMVWRGEYWTLNSSERPNDVVESSLSEVIERQAPYKYFLTVEQLNSLLTRAAVRGKALPRDLEEAIRKQISILSSMPELDECIRLGRNPKDTDPMERLGHLTQEDLPMLYVRRMTPSECEALQGFPEGWTNLGTEA